jgi:hypothetical protein
VNVLVNIQKAMYVEGKHKKDNMKMKRKLRRKEQKQKMNETRQSSERKK